MQGFSACPPFCREVIITLCQLILWNSFFIFFLVIVPYWDKIGLLLAKQIKHPHDFSPHYLSFLSYLFSDKNGNIIILSITFMLESISFINCSYLHNVVLIWSEIVHFFHSVPVLDQTDFEHPIFSIISSQSRTIEMDPTQKMLLSLGQERNVIYSHPVNNPLK